VWVFGDIFDISVAMYLFNEIFKQNENKRFHLGFIKISTEGFQELSFRDE
jgi:hypothetical protein